MARCARQGQLNRLKVAYSIGAEPTADACAEAAVGGHLEVLQWLRSRAECPWNVRTLQEAVRYNHVEIFKWAHINNCPCTSGVLNALDRSCRVEHPLPQWIYQFGCRACQTELFLMDLDMWRVYDLFQ